MDLTESLWPRQPPPARGEEATTLGHWRAETLQQLTSFRRHLAAVLHTAARPSASDESAVERLLLVFEELGSNALRHGRPAVGTELIDSTAGWLLTVSDAAVGSPPVPAVGRDAARGGLGLYLVGRISDAHGWTVAGEYKVAWARIDYRRAEGSVGRPVRPPPPQPPSQ